MEDCITILSDYLPTGDVLRLRRCNIKLKYIIEDSTEIWTQALQRSGYSATTKNSKITPFVRHVENCKKNRKICRECGLKKVKFTIPTSKSRNVSVCKKCIRIKGAYCYMMTPDEIKTFIFKRAQVKFTRKYSSVIKLLPFPFTMGIYWANDVYKIIET